LEVDVLVIGGGTGGFAAGLQSARMGAKTLIIEETPWLGGMITSAGVSAFNGNKYALGGGIYGEFRNRIENYYGGSEKTRTGWKSLTCFEPKIAKELLHEMILIEKNLTVWFEASLMSVIRENDIIAGALIHRQEGTEVEVRAHITIEATEFGDVLALGNVPYKLGRDAKSETGEADAPEKRDNEMQDITYCAILKKYKSEAPAVQVIPNFNPSQFQCSIETDCPEQDEELLNYKPQTWEKFITYSALPSNKYILNWSYRGNDYSVTKDIYEDTPSRKEHFEKAKNLTLSFLHYIQTKLGHSEWGLARDEFPTKDHLPFIPYVRESRRLKGLRLMIEDDVIPAANSFRPQLIKDSIAVGDHPIDHHHRSYYKEPEERLEENLPQTVPFQVPYFALIPEKVDGLIAAEKNISVTHIVNGCTRFQPIVMLIGQAAGAAAALAVKYNLSPKNVSTQELQSVLLNAGCQLFPYFDVPNSHPAYKPTQRLALMGMYIDNEKHTFKPDEIVTKEEAKSLIKKSKFNLEPEFIKGLTRAEAFIKIFDWFSKKS